MSKQEITSNVYYDRAGLGSRQRTLKEPGEKDKSITIDDVNEFFKKNVEAKRKPVGQNSFVAPHSAYEYQMDLFFINDLEDQKFKVGMIMIDVFDKFMHVVAIKGKKEEDLASGMIECVHKMGKKPKIIYTDDEGALSKEAIQEQKIEHHKTRAHANFSERAVRTFKDMLYKRVEADERNESHAKHDEKKGKSNIQWTDYIHEILLTEKQPNDTFRNKIHAERGTETE